MTQQTSDKVHSGNVHTTLFSVISILIQSKEQELDYVLSSADYIFLHNTMQDIIPEMIHKFVSGGKEHNPDHDCNFVATVPHLTEIQKENIDGIFYGRAIQQLARNGAK